MPSVNCTKIRCNPKSEDSYYWLFFSFPKVEAQVFQLDTGLAEQGWGNDPQIKSKPQAGHRGPF